MVSYGISSTDSVSYGHRMGMVWYEWAAKECISMSDNQRFGSAGWAEQGAVQGSAAILDKIRVRPQGWGQEGDPLDTLTAQYIQYTSFYELQSTTQYSSTQSLYNTQHNITVQFSNV